MTTEKELKDQCTPDIIKKLCELAEGFNIYELVENVYKIKVVDLSIVYFTMQSVEHLNNIFPLLIYRAVEGWNKNGDPILIANNKVVYPMTVYLFNNYQPENLTHAECACLHCMLDIFKEEK